MPRSYRPGRSVRKISRHSLPSMETGDPQQKREISSRVRREPGRPIEPWSQLSWGGFRFPEGQRNRPTKGPQIITCDVLPRPAQPTEVSQLCRFGVLRALQAAEAVCCLWCDLPCVVASGRSRSRRCFTVRRSTRNRPKPLACFWRAPHVPGSRPKPSARVWVVRAFQVASRSR